VIDMSYAARLRIAPPGQLDRLSTALRLIWIIPIGIVLAVISASGSSTETVDGETVSTGGTGIAASLAFATLLMLLFRQRYPRWWFDFQLELTRFSARVGAYLLLLTDRYPSTEEAQAVDLQVDYPDATTLNRWLPLVKWLLAIPHYVVLFFLLLGVLGATVIAWFAILVTGRYPEGLFAYVEGVGRWGLRVIAYAFLLVTDEYPPFRLGE